MVVPRPDQDILLWLQFKEGSREAFAAIYEQHAAALIAYGLRLCPDQDVLKDQIQELFVELWYSRNNVVATDNIKFYLFKALRYKLIRAEKARISRHSKARATAISTGHFLQDPVETAIIEREFQQSQTAMLRKAIGALSLRQQEAIQLRYFQGFTHEEIAALMDLNYQSVSNILYKAVTRLKEIVRSPVVFLLALFFFF
jgi:RNA polymerase sigma factor (sigma-70 family)